MITQWHPQQTTGGPKEFVMNAGAFSAWLYPSPREPVIWRVRCTFGHATEKTSTLESGLTEDEAKALARDVLVHWLKSMLEHAPHALRLAGGLMSYNENDLVKWRTGFYAGNPEQMKALTADLEILRRGQNPDASVAECVAEILAFEADEVERENDPALKAKDAASAERMRTFVQQRLAGEGPENIHSHQARAELAQATNERLAEEIAVLRAALVSIQETALFSDEPAVLLARCASKADVALRFGDDGAAP